MKLAPQSRDILRQYKGLINGSSRKSGVTRTFRFQNEVRR